jgi:hypothetical protein
MTCIALASGLAAQDVLGILNNTATTYTSRGGNGSANTNPSEIFDKLDKETYAGWGFDPTLPGMRVIQGLNFLLQDQVGTTAETYGIVVYTEDPALPNYPLVAAPIGSAGPFPTPASTATGAVAWNISVNFATPVQAPAAGDAFVGITLPQPASGTWPTDGVSVHAVASTGATTAQFEAPGFGMPTSPPEEAGFGGFIVPGLSLVAYSSPRQFKVQPIVLGATGVAGAITNATVAPLSNVAPGSSSQFMLYPDAQNPPRNAGRADDISNRWFMTGTADGTPVFFLMDLGSFGFELPLGGFLPGSTGALCLNLGSMQAVGLQFTLAGQAFNVLTIPAGARGAIAGIVLTHQAAALDPVLSVAHASPCTRQVL